MCGAGTVQLIERLGYRLDDREIGVSISSKGNKYFFSSLQYSH
jgi:hypothetical protein